jgi:hypothetical protein
MFIASLVIVTNIFCSTHQAYLLSSIKFSLEETVLDSKNNIYSKELLSMFAENLKKP